MRLTLICSSISYLLRSAYLLIAFIFFKNGIMDAQEFVMNLENKILMLLSILSIVFLTEMLPIASLILTNAFILKQKASNMRSIGQHKRLDIEQELDSDVDDNLSFRSSMTLKSIRSVIIEEFIDKDEQNSRYHYHMKDKKAGREIFWTYHFFWVYWWLYWKQLSSWPYLIWKSRWRTFRKFWIPHKSKETTEKSQ